MFRLGLSIVLALVFALQTLAADQLENAKAATSSAVSTARVDRLSDTVLVTFCVAELLCPAQEGEARMAANDNPGKAKAPSMETDGAAWLAWAKNQGQLRVCAEPTLVTQDNRPVCLQMGNYVPTNSPETRGASAKPAANEQPFVGLKVGLTPRVSPPDQVVLELDIEYSSLTKREGEPSPIIEKTVAQTTISAKDGKTAIVSGLITRSKMTRLTEQRETTLEERRQTIIAVTAHVNPKR